MSEVVVSIQKMYDLLLEVDRKVTSLAETHIQQNNQLKDHEQRLRTLEQEEDVTRRVSDMEDDVHAIRGEIEEIKKRVWAIPSAGIVIALGALVITLIRNF